jgi:hypothetical protein
MNEELDAILQEEFNRMRGRILGFIEACGLPERQENGMKNTFKTLSYDAQQRVTEILIDEDEE